MLHRLATIPAAGTRPTMDSALIISFATQVGYTLRGVTPACLLTIRGVPPLFIDLEARPITVRKAAGTSAPLGLELDAADMASIVPGKERLVDSWIESGRIRATGSSEVVDRLRARMRAGFAARQYAEVDDQITDPRFVFINHGFVELDGSDDFSWVEPDDQPWRYSLNLVRQIVRDVPLDGARILDVSCGRGGAAAYFTRYHAPAEVVGIDLVPGHITFCRATHRAANLRFIEADAQHLPFDDGYFDVVTNIESSHAYPDLDQFFSEVRRVLRPGGVFCLTDNLKKGQIDARTEQLRPYGDVRWVRTITAEVAEALQLAREPVLELVADMVRKAGPEGAAMERFARAILQCRNNYVGGAWDYAVWQMVRT